MVDMKVTVMSDGHESGRAGLAVEVGVGSGAETGETVRNIHKDIESMDMLSKMDINSFGLAEQEKLFQHVMRQKRLLLKAR